MNNKITAIIIVVVLVGGGLLLFKNRGVAPTDMDINSNMPVPGNEVEETEVMKEFYAPFEKNLAQKKEKSPSLQREPFVKNMP